MKSLMVMVSKNDSRVKKLNQKYTKSRKIKRTMAKSVNEVSKDATGHLFKASYGYYFGLDMPAQSAFDTFCEVIRTTDYEQALIYLYTEGQKNKKEIMESYARDTFEHNSPLEERFEFLEKKVKEMQKKNKPSDGK